MGSKLLPQCTTLATEEIKIFLQWLKSDFILSIVRLVILYLKSLVFQHCHQCFSPLGSRTGGCAG